MKVILNEPYLDKIPFGLLRRGDYFAFSGYIYVKITEGAFCFDTDSTCGMYPMDMVRLVKQTKPAEFEIAK